MERVNIQYVISVFNSAKNKANSDFHGKRINDKTRSYIVQIVDHINKVNQNNRINGGEIT